jgi:Rieske Fe-S protein
MSEVTRRSALTAAAAAAVGVVIGVVYGRNSDAAEKPRGAGGGGYGYGGNDNGGSPELITELAAVPEGGGVIKSGVVVTRESGNTVHVFSSVCTHLGCDVNKVSDGKIFCPCHGSVFDAKTGQVLQGPASSPLPSVPFTVKDGGVYTK